MISESSPLVGFSDPQNMAVFFLFFFKSRSNRCRFSAKDNWDTKGRNTPCAKKKVTARWNSEINLEILGVLFLSVLINDGMFC